MTLVYSFLFCGFVCLIGQIILDNTLLTPGHVTSMFVVLGSILSAFNLYDVWAVMIGAGANIPIISFGNALVNGAYTGYQQIGVIGMFGNLLSGVGVGISSAVIFGFILSSFSKVKD